MLQYFSPFGFKTNVSSIWTVNISGTLKYYGSFSYSPLFIKKEAFRSSLSKKLSPSPENLDLCWNDIQTISFPLQLYTFLKTCLKVIHLPFCKR